MKAALENAIATARAMTPRAFERAKGMADPQIVYCLHGDGTGRLIALDRHYRPVGCDATEWIDYAASRFAHLRIFETAPVRALATHVNELGRLNFPSGPTVPILYVLDERDTRETYCGRLRALIEVLQS